MTVVDITVASRVLPMASVRTSPSGAEAACRAESAPFDGWGIVRQALQVRADSLAAAQRTGEVRALSVVQAMQTRGAVLINAAGRVGVVVGYRIVVQPAGRAYAQVSTTEDWWVAAWLPITVVVTLPFDPVRDTRPPPGHPKGGVAQGALFWVGSVVGSRPSQNQATGQVVFGEGAAAGSRPSAATVAGAFTFAGSASGNAPGPKSGTAGASLSWDGLAMSSGESIYNAEGNGQTVADGTAMDATNTGLASVTPGTGATMTFSTDWSHRGLYSWKIVVPAGNATAIARANLPTTTSKHGNGDVYFMLPEYPVGAGVRICGVRSSLGSAMGIGITTAGKVFVQSTTAATIMTGTVDVPLGRALRIGSWANDPSSTTGAGRIALFLGDSDTPLEVLEPAGADFGTANLAAFDVGKVNAANTTAPFTIYFDDLRVASGQRIDMGPVLPPTMTYFGALLGASSRTGMAPVRLYEPELKWRLAEPTNGTYDPSYFTAFANAINTARTNGRDVVLEPGLHYEEARQVARAGATQMVDDLGNVNTDQANVVFSQAQRDAVEAYTRVIAANLDLTKVHAIRIHTTGLQGEVAYPDNRYWAFSTGAQNGADAPIGMPPNPLPGWKPGQAGPSTAQIDAWARWYIQAQMDFMAWHMRLWRAVGFRGDFHIVCAGKGVNPTSWDTLINGRLSASSLIGHGVAYDVLFDAIQDKDRVVVYCSSTGESSGTWSVWQPGDVTADKYTAGAWRVERWMTWVAKTHGLWIGGENPGYGDSSSTYYPGTKTTDMLDRAMKAVKAGGWRVFMLAHESQLYGSPAVIPLARYQAYIEVINGGNSPRPVTV